MSTESSSATFGQAPSRSWEGGYGEVLYCFLQALIRLVKKKTCFVAVPDTLMQLFLWEFWVTILDEFMHAGANCRWHLLHSYWDIWDTQSRPVLEICRPFMLNCQSHVLHALKKFISCRREGCFLWAVICSSLRCLWPCRRKHVISDWRLGVLMFLQKN